MRIFTYRDIPIKLHVSFLILAGLWIAYNLTSVGVSAAIFSTLLGASLFGSVLLHEIGHAEMARAFKIPTRHITLYPFGGIAAIAKEPKAGSEEFFIAIAGPVVNFIIAGFVLPFTFLGSEIVGWILLINVVMGIFNLIPAYPMDGGRILRSLLATKMGKTKATKISLNVSQIFSAIFLCIGIFVGRIDFALIGGFLWFVINSERKRLLQ